MAKSPIVKVQGTAAPLGLDNVDTDQIIAARFLKGTTKEGLGQALFYDLRLNPDGSEKPDFILNQAPFKGSVFLVGGRNFGCGSSREHAPWALKDYGFQVVLASSFAEIFCNNALKNGVLPIVVEESKLEALLTLIKEQPQLSLSVDLPAQTLDLGVLGSVSFSIDPFWKKCLMEGVDQIGYTLSFLPQIEAFEAKHEASWVYAAAATL